MADRKKQTKKMKPQKKTENTDKQVNPDAMKTSPPPPAAAATLLADSGVEMATIEAKRADPAIVEQEEFIAELPATVDLELEPLQQNIHEGVPLNPVTDTTAPVETAKPAADPASWSSWFSGAQQLVNEKLQSGLNTVIEQVEIGFRGIPPDESDDEDDAYTLNSETKKKEEEEVVVDQEHISKMEEDEGEEEAKTTDFNEMINEAARDASKWSINNLMTIKSKSMNLMTDGLVMLDSLGKQTLETMSRVAAAGLEEEDQDDLEPNLSTVLRDAKRRSESRSLESQELKEAQQANFSSLFDEFKGLMSLEALESLCKEATNTSGQLVNDSLAADDTELAAELQRVQLLFQPIEVTDSEINQEFVKDINHFFEKLTVNIKLDVLIKVHDQIQKDTKSFEDSTLKDVKTIHKTAIKAMAEYCAVTIAIFHKLAQLILLDNFIDLTQVQAFRNLNKVIIEEVAVISNQFTQNLYNIKHESIDISTIITPLTTDIFLEATNTRSYINEAYVLLLPIVQQSILKNTIPS